jgi:hypothetical protein
MLLLAGYIAVPSGPSVMVLPGTNKSFDQVYAIGFAWQQYAQQVRRQQRRASGGRNAVADAVAGTLIGGGAGAAIGAAAICGMWYYEIQRRDKPRFESLTGIVVRQVILLSVAAR